MFYAVMPLEKPTKRECNQKLFFFTIMMNKSETNLFNVKHQEKFNNTHCWHEGTEKGSNPAMKLH